MDRDPADETLMLRYREGDAAAFDSLYDRHRGGLFRFLLRQCGSRPAAEEMFQDVWMRVVRARATYEPHAPFGAWLYRIAHNRLIDHYRRHGNADSVSLDDEDCPIGQIAADPAGTPERLAERHERAQRLIDALDMLPPAQREAFLMHEEGGLGLEEIARAAGVGRETVKSRLRYALAKLRLALGADQDEHA